MEADAPPTCNITRGAQVFGAAHERNPVFMPDLSGVSTLARGVRYFTGRTLRLARCSLPIAQLRGGGVAA